MGAGASLDPGLSRNNEDGDRYFCHSCHRVFGLGTIQNPSDYYCPYCQSTFLEELGGVSSQISVRHRTHGNLTADQARRISNATAMLRLLETQLRDELEHLQTAFEVANARFNEELQQEKMKKLTKVMKGRLRMTTINLDMACGQPSCPICSEDFILGSDVLKLPCTHFFHQTCAMPWLDMKQNCPICRNELSDTLPTEDELNKFNNMELEERLKDLEVDEEELELDEEEVAVSTNVTSLKMN
jgi:transposase-like protein